MSMTTLKVKIITILVLIAIATINLGLLTTEHTLALSNIERLNNNINNQHVLGNGPINGGPPQSTFGYYFAHSH